MDEYIDREKLLRDIDHYHVSDGKFQHWVEIQLAADVAPVEWIDVNDRMPEESTSTPVNIVWKNMDPAPYYADIKNKPFVGTAYYYNGKWWWFSCTCEEYLQGYGESDIDCMDDGIVVTHWIPIPAPPEVKQ